MQQQTAGIRSTEPIPPQEWKHGKRAQCAREPGEGVIALDVEHRRERRQSEEEGFFVNCFFLGGGILGVCVLFCFAGVILCVFGTVIFLGGCVCVFLGGLVGWEEEEVGVCLVCWGLVFCGFDVCVFLSSSGPNTQASTKTNINKKDTNTHTHRRFFLSHPGRTRGRRPARHSPAPAKSADTPGTRMMHPHTLPPRPRPAAAAAAFLAPCCFGFLCWSWSWGWGWA